MSDYSLELNEDQLQIQKWVHEFAENVVRPAGPEWDEREETPWPIIEEAAKNGLYSFDFVAQCFSDPTGLLMCLVNGGDELGRRRHRPGHLRFDAGGGRDLRQRDARADRRVDPAVLRDR